MDIETFDKANDLQQAFGKIDCFIEFLKSSSPERHLKLKATTTDDIYGLDISMYDAALEQKITQAGVLLDDDYLFYKGLGKELVEFLIPRLEQRAADLKAQFEQL